MRDILEFSGAVFKPFQVYKLKHESSKRFPVVDIQVCIVSLLFSIRLEIMKLITRIFSNRTWYEFSAYTRLVVKSCM